METKHRKARSRAVLVVEDEPQVLCLLGDVLSDKGYRVTLAANGMEAMAALAGPAADDLGAVVLDIGLPLENGVSVMSFLRSVLHSRVPVLVLTGRDDSEERAMLEQMGVREFLLKPTSAKRLLSALGNALS